ncbi:hypothetical protein M405DRAFT_882098 [Rhizopogon salebrosus TDB-379]|nr:hypothetical protein M405DRAFT_882098 [Rhizopogon salebrosus TDB-379]
MVCGIRRKNRKYVTDVVVSGCHAMWFRDKKDEGVLFPEFYKPFPEVGLALLLTAIRVVLFLAARLKQMTLPGVLMHYRPVWHVSSNEFSRKRKESGERIDAFAAKKYCSHRRLQRKSSSLTSTVEMVDIVHRLLRTPNVVPM